MDSENGKKALTESELIDRQVEEIMTDEESAEGGKRKKKRRKKARSGEKPSLKERWKGYSRKRKIITVVVVLAAAAFLLSRCGGGEKGPVAVPVNVMSLTRQPIKEKLSVSGPVSGTDSVDVVSNIHAEIITMNVKEGDKVTKDQILAVLDEIYETFVISCVLAGKVDIADFWERKEEYLQHEWIKQPKKWIDPVKESNATKTAMQTGQKTFKQIAAENGRDWQTQIDDMAEVLKYGQKKGIDLGGVVFGGKVQKKEENSTGQNDNGTDGGSEEKTPVEGGTGAEAGKK